MVVYEDAWLDIPRNSLKRTKGRKAEVSRLLSWFSRQHSQSSLSDHRISPQCSDNRPPLCLLTSRLVSGWICFCVTAVCGSESVYSRLGHVNKCARTRSKSHPVDQLALPCQPTEAGQSLDHSIRSLCNHAQAIWHWLAGRQVSVRLGILNRSRQKKRAHLQTQQRLHAVNRTLRSLTCSIIPSHALPAQQTAFPCPARPCFQLLS